MKKSILSRYELTEDNRLIIDVAVRTIEHLYHNYDKVAPYHRKELDQEFVDYLIESIREVYKRDFIIRISFEIMPPEVLLERVRGSISNYFLYLVELEVRNLKIMIKRSLILLVLGLILLALAIAVTQRISLSPGVLKEVFAQGLTVAAWVSLWEAMANLLLAWLPHHQDTVIYKKGVNSPVLFSLLSDSADRLNG